MESTKPTVFASGNTEGIERVKDGNGKYEQYIIFHNDLHYLRQIWP